MKKTITTLAAVAVLVGAAAAAADAPPPLLGFYPQAGTLGQDLFVANHVDLKDGPGILDFACSDDTYDGHSGQDTGIRSFREVAIGVPVFAALDGRVFGIQFAVGGDLNWGATVSRFDNHIILDHGGGVYTIYGHLARRSIKVKKGQWVPAGAQIGLTASSGNSSGPHLHFTVQNQGAISSLRRRVPPRVERLVEPACARPRRVRRQRHAERQAVQRAARHPLRRGRSHGHLRPRRA